MVPKKFGKDDIFKYGSLKDLERTLNDETLGFSKLSDYNDPFESEYSTYLFIENSVKRANFMRTDVTQKYEPKIWESHEKIKDWIADYLKTQKVTCFSQSPIEPLMWSHYAEKHHGVCYWFDKTSVSVKGTKFYNILRDKILPFISRLDLVLILSIL